MSDSPSLPPSPTSPAASLKELAERLPRSAWTVGDQCEFNHNGEDPALHGWEVLETEYEGDAEAIHVIACGFPRYAQPLAEFIAAANPASEAASHLHGVAEDAHSILSRALASPTPEVYP